MLLLSADALFNASLIWVRFMFPWQHRRRPELPLIGMYYEQKISRFNTYRSKAIFATKYLSMDKVKFM